MILVILASFAGVFAAPLVHRVAKKRAGWWITLLPLGLFVYFAQFLPQVAGGGVLSETVTWVPSLGVTLAFRLDGLSLLFALLITGIGALVVVYASGYMAGYENEGRFYLFLLGFMSSMLGLVLANNLIALFLFWELTSITSYLLIGFKYQSAESRSAALQAFLVTGGGGLAMLGGLILLGMAGGSYEISELVATGSSLADHALFVPALLLILLGAFTKSAQFPFHFWLPNAMVAPTPVSSYLHSATMVKAGVYLLARLWPVFSASSLWQGVVTGVGLVTMLVGAFLALKSSDMKRILAYSTISSLGTMTMLLGFGTEAAAKAAIVFLLAHALYKGALFMLAGAVDHETGTRDVDQLGGLRDRMPLLAGLTVLAAVSLAGLGPLVSFIGKELLFEAALAQSMGWLLAAAAVLSSAVSVALALILVLRPFFGAPKQTPQPGHDPSVTLWLGPVVLGGLGLVMGLLPGWVARHLAQPAVRAVVNDTLDVKLSLWHGLNLALGLSAMAIALGTLFYLGWDRWRKGIARIDPALRWGPEAAYSWSIVGLNWIAAVQTRILQNGSLRFYLLVIILATVLLTGSFLFLHSGGLVWRDVLTRISINELALAILIVIAALAAVRSHSRLGAIAAMGVVGYGVALIFLQFGAPDLAMTQFLIESITVVLFVFAFYHLPRFDPISPPGPRLLQAIVAIFVGILMGGLALSASQINLFPKISTYFNENAVSLAHGRNIVNVILVDFRGFDTLGEITVLAVAALGVFAILKYKRGSRQ